MRRCGILRLVTETLWAVTRVIRDGRAMSTDRIQSKRLERVNSSLPLQFQTASRIDRRRYMNRTKEVRGLLKYFSIKNVSHRSHLGVDDVPNEEIQTGTEHTTEETGRITFGDFRKQTVVIRSLSGLDACCG